MILLGKFVEHLEEETYLNEELQDRGPCRKNMTKQLTVLLDFSIDVWKEY